MTNKEAIEYGKKWDGAIESRGDTPFSDARQFLNLAIKALAEQERPTGKWLEWEDERWGGVWHYCSNCHNDALYKRVDGTFKQILSDCCPNCGAKMKQEAENE